MTLITYERLPYSAYSRNIKSFRMHYDNDRIDYDSTWTKHLMHISDVYETGRGGLFV